MAATSEGFITRSFCYGKPMNGPTVDPMTGISDGIVRGICTEPYYSRSAFFVTNDECDGVCEGGRSWADFKRPHNGAESVQRIIRLLVSNVDASVAPTDPNAVVHVYFLRIPSVGFLFLVCIESLNTMYTWSTNVIDQLRTVQKASKAGSAPKAGTNASHAEELNNTAYAILAINACIHPLTARQVEGSLYLQPDEYYTTGNIKTFSATAAAHQNRSDGQKKRHRRQAGVAEEPPEEEPVEGCITAAVIHDMLQTDPCAIFNPFMALAVDRIFTSASLANLDAKLASDTSLNFLCTDLEASIFLSDGRIDFARLPADITAYRINIQCMTADWFFPDQLPPIADIRHALERQNRNFLHVMRDMSDDGIRDNVLHQREVPDYGLRFFNPVDGTHYTERVTIGTYDMPYLKTFASNIASATASMKKEELREYTISQFERIIVTMSEDVTTTPDAPRGLAKSIRDLLPKLGMHFLRPLERPSKTSAWLAWLISEFNHLRASVHHVTILLRCNLAILTMFVTRNGGVQLCISGAPSDGKSHTCEKQMKLIWYDMVPCQSFSQQFLFSAAAQHQLRFNYVFWDELAPNSFGGPHIDYQLLKLLVARVTSSTRMRDDSYRKVEKGAAKSSKPTTHGVPGPITLVGASNYTLPVIVRQHEQNIHGNASAGASRIYNIILPCMPSTVNQNIILSNLCEGNADSELAGAERLRFYFATCAIVALFVSERIIPTAYNVEHICYARLLAQEFAKVCPSYPSKDQRLANHLISLPFVAAIMELVYEVIMTGPTYNDAPSLRDYCANLFFIAERLIPTLEHVVFGVSMMMDIFNVVSPSDTLAASILEFISCDTYQPNPNPDIPSAFYLSQRAIASLAKDLGIDVKDLNDQLKAMATTPVDNPTHNPLSAFASRADPRTANAWFLNPFFLRRSIDSRSPVDAAIVDHVKMVDDLPSAPFYTVPVLQLIAALQAAATQPGWIGASTSIYFIEIIKKRHYLGFFQPTRSAETDAGVNWIHLMCDATARQFTDPVQRAVWERRSVDISNEYLAIFDESARDMSRVARVIRQVIKRPGQYPICSPAADMRIPQVICIEASDTPAPHHTPMTYFDPALISAAPGDPILDDWRASAFAFNDQQELTPFDFCQLKRLIESYNHVSIGTMTLDRQRKLIHAVSIAAIQQRTINAAGRDIGPISAFKLRTLEDLYVSSDKGAARSYLRNTAIAKRTLIAGHDTAQPDETDDRHSRMQVDHSPQHRVPMAASPSPPGPAAFASPQSQPEQSQKIRRISRHSLAQTRHSSP